MNASRSLGRRHTRPLYQVRSRVGQRVAGHHISCTRYHLRGCSRSSIGSNPPLRLHGAALLAEPSGDHRHRDRVRRSDDPVQIDRLFRRSALLRPNWDERHSRDRQTYGDLILQKVLDPDKCWIPTGLAMVSCGPRSEGTHWVKDETRRLPRQMQSLLDAANRQSPPTCSATTCALSLRETCRRPRA